MSLAYSTYVLETFMTTSYTSFVCFGTCMLHSENPENITSVIIMRLEREFLPSISLRLHVQYTCNSYINLINQARGPHWENIGPRSWQYGSSAARSVQKRPRADIIPVRSRASLVNKRFITWLKKAKTAKTQVRNHSGQCPVRYLENIVPAIEHFDWLILVIGPLTAWVV